ncbi:MAG: hypothetical protein ACKN82_13175, partial [Pirellula sp.]
QPSQPWTGPRWVGRYASVGMRRPGDESYTLSQGGQLGTFGSDQANQITIGYLTNPIDCYEFSYLGSLRWNRALESTGPVNSQISSNDPSWSAPFQNADLHQVSDRHLRNWHLRNWHLGDRCLGLNCLGREKPGSLRLRWRRLKTAPGSSFGPRKITTRCRDARCRVGLFHQLQIVLGT